MFENLRQRLARLIAPPPPPPRLAVRMYVGAKASRLTEGFGAITTSADSELSTSLRVLRARSRQLMRDAPYAKRARVIVVNNVIGAGIGLQATVTTNRDELNEPLNDAIETAWAEWCAAESCHTGGSLHFSDFERAAMAQVFEAGEVFIRLHPRRFGNSEIPLALELIEPERLADQFQPGPQAPGAMVRLGIEVDEFYRPVAYWIRRAHPGDLGLPPALRDQLERAPAAQIIHLRLIDRWPQTRGEPWLHTALRRLNDMDGYSEAEIVAARAAANYVGFIETPEPTVPGSTEQADGTREVALEPGTVERLAIGEKFNGFSPNRPNAAMDPFMRMMLREVAAGAGVSYESLSRDYSQSNYSSSRLALLDDRDLWRVLQQWWLRALRLPLHRLWLQQAVLARALPRIALEAYAADPRKYDAARFKPRGWSWIDPTKEVEAFKEAVRGGFTTVSDVIAQTGAGRDLEDVLTERARELRLMDAQDLQFDTDPVFAAAPAPAAPPADDESDDDDEPGIPNEPGDSPRRVVALHRLGA